MLDITGKADLALLIRRVISSPMPTSSDEATLPRRIEWHFQCSVQMQMETRQNIGFVDVYLQSYSACLFPIPEQFDHGPWLNQGAVICHRRNRGVWEKMSPRTIEVFHVLRTRQHGEWIRMRAVNAIQSRLLPVVRDQNSEQWSKMIRSVLILSVQENPERKPVCFLKMNAFQYIMN